MTTEDTFVAAIDRMTASVQASSAALAEDVRELRIHQEKKVNAVQAVVEAERHGQRTFRIAVVGALAVLIVVVLVLVGLVHKVVAVQKQGRAVGKQIADCTSPGGACYERNRAQTGVAIAALNRQSMIIAECAKLTMTAPELDKCVQRKTEEEQLAKH